MRTHLADRLRSAGRTLRVALVPALGSAVALAIVIIDGRRWLA